MSRLDSRPKGFESMIIEIGLKLVWYHGVGLVVVLCDESGDAVSLSSRPYVS